jgi:diaminopimelate epimerase
MGRAIRYHEAFAPAGTNVNFVVPAEGERLQVRTYERGVEDETLACGTGCVASALITAARREWSSPIPVTTRSGGILTIHFQQDGRQFHEVYLEGDARIVYRGDLQPDALMA